MYDAGQPQRSERLEQERLTTLVTAFIEKAAELGELGDQVHDLMRQLANRGVGVDDLAVLTRLTKVDVERVLHGVSFLQVAAGRPQSDE